MIHVSVTEECDYYGILVAAVHCCTSFSPRTSCPICQLHQVFIDGTLMEQSKETESTNILYPGLSPEVVDRVMSVCISLGPMSGFNLKRILFITGI